MITGTTLLCRIAHNVAILKIRKQGRFWREFRDARHPGRLDCLRLPPARGGGFSEQGIPSRLWAGVGRRAIRRRRRGEAVESAGIVVAVRHPVARVGLPVGPAMHVELVTTALIAVHRRERAFDDHNSRSWALDYRNDARRGGGGLCPQQRAEGHPHAAETVALAFAERGRVEVAPSSARQSVAKGGRTPLSRCAVHHSVSLHVPMFERGVGSAMVRIAPKMVAERCAPHRAGWVSPISPSGGVRQKASHGALPGRGPRLLDDRILRDQEAHQARVDRHASASWSKVAKEAPAVATGR